MSVSKTTGSVDFSQDVPSHCIGLALEVALDLSWDFVDAEEDQEASSYSYRVGAADVGETGDC